MLLTPENWNHCDFTPHSVVKVDFDAEEIREAYAIAQLKLPHTGVYDPGGAVRDATVMINRIVSGELADQAVTKILNEYYASRSLQCMAIEYDSIRRDDFQNNAPYSIQIQNHGVNTKTAEVRSSFCYRLRDTKAMLNKLSIYGWYTSYGKPTENQKDLYFQVFYHLRPESVPKKDEWPNVPVFEECLRGGRVTAYVVGGADRDLLSNSGATKKDDVSGAFYQAIFPADTGYDIEKMCYLSST